MRGVSDRPSRSDDLNPEDSDRYDDLAHYDPLGPERIAAELRKAALAFQPDDERLRQIINARSGNDGPLRTTPSIVEPHRPGGGRRKLLWPVAGSAAAAAVILGVFARGALPVAGDTTSGTGTVSSSDSVTIGIAGTSDLASATGSGTPETPSPDTSASSGPDTAAATPTSPTVTPPTSSPTEGQSFVPDPAPPVSSTPGSSPAATPTRGPTTTRAIGAGRDLTVSVRPVPPGSTADVVKTPSDEWVVASENAASSQGLSSSSSGVLGPVQGLGGGYTTGAGPFTVRRPDPDSGAEVTSTSWITAPGMSAGAPSGLRVPVRFQKLPATITLFVGTSAGRGRMTVTVHSTTNGGSPLELPVELPSCVGNACPSVVTVVLGPSAVPPSTGSGTTPGVASGTILIDLRSSDPAGRIGFAAASLR
ncbi:MAG: hypothetical protein QG622_583 [Actinomycetota bacterium]|nr:hypothetical protein [Actinomycetota bacterium]